MTNPVNSDDLPPARVHASAIVEDGVTLGAGTVVFDGAHIRAGARVGRSTIVGGKAYLGPGVTVGDHVKLNSAVYLCTGVTIEDFCMVSAHCVFTNERFPRAGDPELRGLRTSDPTEHTLSTVVRRGATLGAHATIGPGLEIGAFAMVGMGAVVTRDVAPHALVVGNPSRPVGWVCVCGPSLPRGGGPELECDRCGRRYELDGDGLIGLPDGREIE